MTIEAYLSHINDANDGQHLLNFIDLLLNSAQHYAYSLTMNTIIKIGS
jgi:hypothetical protein